MPNNFSIAAGTSAMNGRGASSAASGIQVWNGIEPPFATAPIIKKTNARLPRPFSGRLICDIVNVPASRPVSAIPNSRQRSVMPMMTKALIAVLYAPGRPIMIMPNMVKSKPSQKKRKRIRLLASSVPLARASVNNRYAKNCPANGRSDINTAE